jgi:hypothetical protein
MHRTSSAESASESGSEFGSDVYEQEIISLLKEHLQLFDTSDTQQQYSDEIKMAPLFCGASSMIHDPELFDEAFKQYGLLGGHAETLAALGDSPHADPRIFYNVTTPSSVFICGSQGSGKSHTLSCLLENCLIPSIVTELSNPLTGLVFHFDSFASDTGGSPCEAAFLSSDPDVDVRVFCAPTNVATIKVLLTNRLVQRGFGLTISPEDIQRAPQR